MNSDEMSEGIKMKNIFIFGYYGFRNTGDEAILCALTENIKRIMPDTEITALTYNSHHTEEHYNVDAISRNNFKDVINAIAKSDVVISGGGSILQDVTSSRSLLYYLWIIWLAKRYGKKVMFYGNGFGPITKLLNRKAIGYLINKVDVITVRDFESKERMQSLGINKEIIVTADATFSLEFDIEPTEKAGSKKKIGISLRNWKGKERYKEILAKTADYLIKRNYEVIFIPMQYPNDLKISSDIESLMTEKPTVIVDELAPREIINLISGLDLLIGMRLHSLIFATLAGVPVVGLEYEAKISSYLKIINQPSGGKAETLDQIHFWTVIDEVLTNRNEYRERIVSAREQLKQKASVNISILEDFLQKEI